MADRVRVAAVPHYTGHSHYQRGDQDDESEDDDHDNSGLNGAAGGCGGDAAGGRPESRSAPGQLLAVRVPSGPVPAVPGSARPVSARLPGDQVVGEQQDGRAGDGGEPGGGVEEPVEGVDVEDLGGEPAAEQCPDDADDAGKDEALLSAAGDQHVGDEACGQA